MTPAKPEIRVRRATPADSREIWLWRNDAQTRLMSKTLDEVAWDDHNRWYARTLTDPAKALLIGEVDDLAVGMCRFDYNVSALAWEVSINLNPAYRGQGLSTAFLAASLATIGKAEQGDFIAEIRHENAASRQCFTKNGFFLVSETPDIGRYRLRREAEA